MSALYVIATPIGNLEDLSPRARRLLGQVQLILAEDTRVTAKLLSAFGIQVPLESLHGHNEHGKADGLARRILAQGLQVALVSDAGTPGISDPGAYLVASCRALGVPVYAVPGPSAFAAALSISGFEQGQFTFYGFLPRKQGELVQKLQGMAGRCQLAVVYEAPHRVQALLQAIHQVFPDSPVFLAREISKKFEQSLLGTAHSLLAGMAEDPKQTKGEFVLVLDLSNTREVPVASPQDLPLEAQLVALMAKGNTLREAVQALTAQGVRKNQVYAASLRLKDLLSQGAED